MKKPDRWDRIVTKEQWGNELHGYFLRPEHVLKLLRQQHRAYVRMVRDYRRSIAGLRGDLSADFADGYDQCAMEVLQRFKDRAR